MIFFAVCFYKETVIFIITNVSTTTSAKICSFTLTYFASILCQKLGIIQAICCPSFTVIISWITTRNNISHVTRIFYRLSCLVSLCAYLSPPVVNNILFNILVELCRVLVIPPLTSLTKIVVINILHSKD